MQIVGILKADLGDRAVSFNHSFFAAQEMLSWLAKIENFEPRLISAHLQSAPPAASLAILFGGKVRTASLVVLARETSAINIAELAQLINVTYQQVRSTLRALERDRLVVREGTDIEKLFRIADDYEGSTEFRRLLSAFEPVFKIISREENVTAVSPAVRSCKTVDFGQLPALTVLQSRVLIELSSEGLSASVLSERTGLRRHAVLEVISSLSKKRLVSSRVARVGNRKRLVAYLTDPEYFVPLIVQCNSDDLDSRILARSEFSQALLRLTKV